MCLGVCQCVLCGLVWVVWVVDFIIPHFYGYLTVFMGCIPHFAMYFGCIWVLIPHFLIFLIFKKAGHSIFAKKWLQFGYNLTKSRFLQLFDILRSFLILPIFTHLYHFFTLITLAH